MRVMPRKAIPDSPEAKVGRKLLDQYFTSTGETLNSLAKQVRVTQSTLHRFYNGQTKTVSPKMQRVLDYAHNQLVQRITLHKKSTESVNSLVQHPDIEQLLRRLIEAIEPVLASNWPK